MYESVAKFLFFSFFHCFHFFHFFLSAEQIGIQFNTTIHTEIEHKAQNIENKVNTNNKYISTKQTKKNQQKIKTNNREI
jgi:hypothetical protein